MLTTEELFRRAEEHQEKFKDFITKPNFWQALWLVFKALVYYGGADVLFNGKVYKIRTEDDALMLFLDIYDTYKDVYKK
jgi:hypothetical protein